MLIGKKSKRVRSLGWRIVRSLLFICVSTTVLLAILVMAFEDKLIYFPTKYPDGYWSVDTIRAAEGEIVPKVEDCYFKTSDGVALHGWHCMPQQSASGSMQSVPAEMVLLWFHGNAGNISYRYDMIRMLVKLPVQVFIIDYRGYGRSEGAPTEKGLYLDARAAWDYLTNERGVRPENIIVFGKSLGGAVAIDLATGVEPAGLIVQSSFTSAADMAMRVLPLFPPFLLRTKFDSISKIARIGCRKLFIHSRADEVIPYELGHRLYEAAPEPKEFYEIERAPHNETYIAGGKPYFDALRCFIQSCTPGPKATQREP